MKNFDHEKIVSLYNNLKLEHPEFDERKLLEEVFKSLRTDFTEDDGNWVTIKGTHVLIKEGETKKEAIEKFLSEKKEQPKKEENKETLLKNKINQITKNYSHLKNSKEVKNYIQTELSKLPKKYQNLLPFEFLEHLKDSYELSVTMLDEHLESPATIRDIDEGKIYWALHPSHAKKTTSVNYPMHEIGHAVESMIPEEKWKEFRELHKKYRDDIDIKTSFFYESAGETFAESFAEVYSNKKSLTSHSQFNEFIKNLEKEDIKLSKDRFFKTKKDFTEDLKPKYYCKICKENHFFDSDIGKEHLSKNQKNIKRYKTEPKEEINKDKEEIKIKIDENVDNLKFLKENTIDIIKEAISVFPKKILKNLSFELHNRVIVNGEDVFAEFKLGKESKVLIATEGLELMQSNKDWKDDLKKRIHHEIGHSIYDKMTISVPNTNPIEFTKLMKWMTKCAEYYYNERDKYKQSELFQDKYVSEKSNEFLAEMMGRYYSNRKNEIKNLSDFEKLIHEYNEIKKEDFIEINDKEDFTFPETMSKSIETKRVGICKDCKKEKELYYQGICKECYKKRERNYVKRYDTLDMALLDIAIDYEYAQTHSIYTRLYEEGKVNTIEFDMSEDAESDIPNIGSNIPSGNTRLQKLWETQQAFDRAKRLSQQMGVTPAVTGPESVTHPFTVKNTETGIELQGEVVENLQKNQKQLTPVSSSNVRGVGQFGNELLVQFHPSKLTPMRTYRYMFGSPDQASEAYKSLTETGSPGRWVWQNLRGHVAGTKVTQSKIGPSLSPPGQGLPTIGGTSASIVPYTISNRVPVQRVQNFDEILREMKRNTPNPIADPMTGRRIEALLATRKELRKLNVKGWQSRGNRLGRLPPAGDFTEDYPVEGYERTSSKGVKHSVVLHKRGEEIVKDKEILERVKKYQEQREKDKARSQKIIENKDKDLKATKIEHREEYFTECSTCNRKLKKAIHTNKGIMGYRCYLNAIGLPPLSNAQISFGDLPKSVFEEMSDSTIQAIKNIKKEDLLKMMEDWVGKGKVDNIEYAKQVSPDCIIYKDKGDFNKPHVMELFRGGSSTLAKVLGMLPEVFNKITDTKDFNKWWREEGMINFTKPIYIIGKENTEIETKKLLPPLIEQAKEFRKKFEETGQKFFLNRYKETQQTIYEINEELKKLQKVGKLDYIGNLNDMIEDYWVKGHWRHLASGKKVWVTRYEKGKNENEPNPFTGLEKYGFDYTNYAIGEIERVNAMDLSEKTEKELHDMIFYKFNLMEGSLKDMYKNTDKARDPLGAKMELEKIQWDLNELKTKIKKIRFEKLPLHRQHNELKIRLGEIDEKIKEEQYGSLNRFMLERQAQKIIEQRNELEKQIPPELYDLERWINSYTESIKYWENELKSNMKSVELTKTKINETKEELTRYTQYYPANEGMIERMKNQIEFYENDLEIYNRSIDNAKESIETNKKYLKEKQELLKKRKEYDKQRFFTHYELKIRIGHSFRSNVRISREINITNSRNQNNIIQIDKTFKNMPTTLRNSVRELHVFNNIQEGGYYKSASGVYFSENKNVFIGLRNPKNGDEPTFNYSQNWMREVVIHECAHGLHLGDNMTPTELNKIEDLYNKNHIILSLRKEYGAKDSMEFFAEAYTNLYMKRTTWFKDLNQETLPFIKKMRLKYDFFGEFSIKENIIEDMTTQNGIKFSYTDEEGNHIFGIVRIPDDMTREEAELLVSEYKAMYIDNIQDYFQINEKEEKK